MDCKKTNFIDYIVNHTNKRPGNSSIYECKISGLHFSWEDSDMHFNYLIKNNLIK